ncbi:MAG: creatininase family protein [Proteobacteria bacterium]|nr:creatininase family protein [Pseudomonadota bacterium]
MPKTKCLEEMTWPQFEAIAKDCDTILMPVGSVEQEGLHLPMATDSIVALEVAKRVSEVSNVLVAPLINIGYSNWHSAFPGTLNLSMETLIQTLREICMTLVQNGMRRFLFINPHIGNEESIYSVGTELRKKGLGIAGMINLWKLANEMGKDIGELNEKVFKHAGEIMTSVMLALRPDLVDMSKAKKGFLSSETDSIEMETSRRCKFRGYHVEIFRMSKELTDTGVMGDPSGATKSKGEEIIRRWVEYTSSFIDEFKKIPLSA